MKPFYEDTKAGIVIYHGRCEEIVPGLPKSDLLLTDPPYGIDADNRKRILSRANIAKARDYGESQWDKSPPPSWVVSMLVEQCRSAIMWGGNYFPLPPSPCWLVWDKDNGENDFADCELAWTNLQKAVRKIRYRWNGMLQEKMGEEKEIRYHPTQKPLDVMTWCITQAPETVQTILDPYMGSGSTLRAAKDLGKKCIGIEINEAYAEIAAKRLSQEVFSFQ